MDTTIGNDKNRPAKNELIQGEDYYNNKKAIGFSLLNTISKEDTVVIVVANIVLTVITKEKTVPIALSG